MLLLSFVIKAKRRFILYVNMLMRNQKETFYFDDYVVAIMVGIALFILPFLGESDTSKINGTEPFSWNDSFCDTKMFKIRKRTKFLYNSSNN